MLLNVKSDGLPDTNFAPFSHDRVQSHWAQRAGAVRDHDRWHAAHRASLRFVRSLVG